MAKFRNILLIDDDNIFNFINKRIIKIEDFAKNVSTYVNAQKALNYLNSISEFGSGDFPEIIFLDINMPVMDGWEFLDEFEKLPATMLSKCEVFMLTSSIDPNDIERSKTYRTVKDFISKPLTPEILAQLRDTNNRPVLS